MVELPYGRAPYRFDLRGRSATVVGPPPQPGPIDVSTAFDRALDVPIGRPRVEALVSPGARVTIVVSDQTRNEPRAELIAAVRARLPRVHLTLAVATGTHGLARLEQLGIDGAWFDRIVNHDGLRDDDLVNLGTTTRGTPVRLHRCIVESDLVIATGCIRPHYFAGFGAGVKAIFPGLGAADAVRKNHELKTMPGARAGILEGNPCRSDLEEAVGMVPTPTYLVNGVCAFDGRVAAAVAGDVVAAFRVGAERARPWFTVLAPRARVVIASDVLPVTASLYQAAKIAAAVAPLVEAGGILVLVAECADGIGPLDTVNEAIFRIGVLPRLPIDSRILLVSSLHEQEVQTTLLSPARSVDEVLAATEGSIVVVPRASGLLFS